VENEAILRKVRELGVAYAQGYFIHKPEPLETVLSALAEDESRRADKFSLEF
jgi:EAL domain-containing protein (putative c-di-GMP-specific phosphodiesterase class I)